MLNRMFRFIVAFLILALIGLIFAYEWLPEISSGDTQGLFGDAREIAFGLEGKVYFLPPGARQLPNFAQLQPEGTIYTPAFDIPTRSFDQGFPGITDRFEWFAIDYQGHFFVGKGGEYRFRLTSDDGSRLFIDDTLVIDLDGTHATASKEGRITLNPGFHGIRVQYFQGPRYHVALVLEAAGPDEAYRIFNAAEWSFLRVNLYWLRILISLLGYIALIVLSAYILFEMAYAFGMRARYARVLAVMFFLTLLPLIISVHLVGVLQRSYGAGWLSVMLALLMLAILVVGGGKSGKQRHHRIDDSFE
jgi:hypothetical protein